MIPKRVLAFYCAIFWIVILGHIIRNIQQSNPFKHNSLNRALYQSPWSYLYTDRPCSDKIYENEFRGFSKLQSEFWSSLNKTTIQNARVEWKYFIDNFEYPQQTFKGRGIIFSAYASLNLVFLKQFREFTRP